MNADSYHEMILIASSDYLEIGNENFLEYYMPWANYLLSACAFPFNKVIYVSERSEKAVLIYDKEKPLEISPKIDINKEVEITHVHGSLLPCGKSVNISGMFEEDPIVLPKSKLKKKKKKKNKNQSQSRKVNRNSKK